MIKPDLLDRNGVLSHIVAHPPRKISTNGGRYGKRCAGHAAVADQALHECIAHAGDCKSLGLCSQRSSFLNLGAGQRQTGHTTDFLAG